MIKSPRFLISVLLIFLCACTKKPDFELADGKAGTFDQWNGKWVIINYWATWCGPCHEEIPELNAFYKAHSEVVLVGVNFDNSQGVILNEDIKKMTIEFPVLTQDPAKALQFQTPSVLPATVIINPQGKVQTILFGPQTQKSVMAAIGLTQ
jgi:thiol-disulfide isomerase/thioredoxin